MRFNRNKIGFELIATNYRKKRIINSRRDLIPANKGFAPLLSPFISEDSSRRAIPTIQCSNWRRYCKRETMNAEKTNPNCHSLS